MTSSQVVRKAPYEAKKDDSRSFIETMHTLLLPKFPESSRLLHQLVVGYNCARKILHNSFLEGIRVLFHSFPFQIYAPWIMLPQSRWHFSKSNMFLADEIDWIKHKWKDYFTCLLDFRLTLSVFFYNVAQKSFRMAKILYYIILNKYKYHKHDAILGKWKSRFPFRNLRKKNMKSTGTKPPM